MRKVFYFMAMTTIMTSFLFISCGDSEDDGGQNNNIDENFIIQNGKRLTELSLYNDSGDYYRFFYKIEYDSMGRMSKLRKRLFFRDLDGSQNKNSNNYSTKFEIDYEQRSITDSQKISSFIGSKPIYQKYIYSLNEDGYISQINNGYFSYNEKGYLVKYDNYQYHSILDYDHYNIQNASVEHMKTGLIHAYFISFEKSDKKELYIRYKSTDKNRLFTIDDDGIGIIALFSGLFGKIPTNFLFLKSEDEVNAFLGIDRLNNDQYQTWGRLILKYE